MRVKNLNEAYEQQLIRKQMSGEFGYGQDLGAAIADHILDDASEASWTQQQLNNAQVKWREMVLNFQNAVRSRNAVIGAIKAMPAGVDKTIAVGAFNEADGIFMQAYGQAQPIFAEVGALTGDSFPAVESTNFGLAPLAIWGIVAASLVAVAYISTSMYEANQRYEALLQNPEIGKYDKPGSLLTELGAGIGTGLKWAIFAGAAFLIMAQMRKA